MINEFGSNFYSFIWIFVYFAVLFAVGIPFFYFVIIRSRRRRHEKTEQYAATFLQIKLPQQNEIEIENAKQLFSGLVGIRKSWWRALWHGQYRISFEIVSKTEGITFYVVTPDKIAQIVEKQIHAAYPEAEIDLVNPHEVWDRGKFTSVAELRLSGAPYYPIKTYEELPVDSLNAITSAMSKLDNKEVVALQYLISPARSNWVRQGEKFIHGVRHKAEDPERKIHIDEEFLKGVEKKITQSAFDVSIRVISIAEDKTAADEHIQNITNAFEQFTDVKYNRFRKRKPLTFKFIHNFIYRVIDVVDISIPLLDICLYRNTSVLNVEEMATVFHFPNKEVQTPNIVWLTARKAPAPSHTPTEGIYIGKNEYRGAEKKIYMLEDDRKRHFYIIGQTGTGKSEFMKSLAYQDILNGEGVAFIDPHGSDIDDLLTKIPSERIDDVILFDVSDVHRPLGLNILEADSEEQKHMNINSFIALLYKLYDPNRQGIMGPRLERAIRNIMLTAMVDPESTLVDVYRLIIDPKYVDLFLPKVTDPLVKRYWVDEIAQTNDFHKSEVMGYFVSKFDRFVTDKTLRNILAQPKSAVDFNKIMAEKKILLVDLSKGKIGEENSSFLGLILVPKILAAALARASQAAGEYPNFYLYIDEFQNFVTPDIATILSEARKYKLNLTVAHQFVAQLPDEIKEAVFGNVGTLVSFRIGVDDAEYLEHQFNPPFIQSDLLNLSVGNCYVRLLVNGQPTVPFSLRVDWDYITSLPKDPSVAEQVREKSRLKYGVPVEEVDLYVNSRTELASKSEASVSPPSTFW